MSVELVILDFDGTLTDSNKEAASFIEGYKADLSKDLDLSREHLEKKWTIASNKIDSQPNKFGWKINNHIVAPAYANPFIYCGAVADILLDNANLFSGFDERQHVLNKYFISNYNKLIDSFWDDTYDFLSFVKNSFDTCIVTSSDSLKVKSKLELLGVNIPVFGSACKHELDFAWNIPEFVNRDSYNRPLFLRRRKYWDVLSSLLDEKNLKPEQLVVVGDSYELDLLLPEYNNMNIVFLPNDKVPSFEINAVKSCKNGFVVNSLSEIITYLKK